MAKVDFSRSVITSTIKVAAIKAVDNKVVTTELEQHTKRNRPL